MTDFDTVVHNAIDDELTGDEVLKLFGSKLNFMLYEKLYSCNSLADILEGKDGTVILYQYEKFEGHYVLLMKRNDNEYEYFDPLGYEVDYALAYFRYDKSPQLSDLIRRHQNNGGTVTINKQKFERDAERINTCGKHVIVRYSFKEMNLSEYTHFIKSSRIKSDRLVTMLTLIIKH
jgi:hypothetical protein